MSESNTTDPPPHQQGSETYAATLTIDYPDRALDRVSTLLRIFWIIPIGIVLATIGSLEADGGAILSAPVLLPVLLMIVFRQKYPRWWFDFNLEFVRFETRVLSYLALMDDRYPSTDEEQSVHLDVAYPDVKQDLNRWLPLVKWLLAVPHYIVLVLLAFCATVAVIIAWFSVLFTGKYPRSLFNFVEGVFRWGLRVQAYAFLLVTDQYPPFRLR
jgi:hypothetical protein